MPIALNHLAPTRRKVLVGAGAGGVLAAAGARALFGSLPGGPAGDWSPGSLAQASAAQWRKGVGETFAMSGSGTRLTLVAVKPLLATGRRPAAARPEAFALVFETRDSSAPAGDAIHRLAHRSAARLDLHLGARIAAGARSRFLAVFN